MKNTILKYPILLVHGMGFRDSEKLNYWGRIPSALEKQGCRIYYGGQDSNGTIEDNGKVLAERIQEIVDKEGVEKVNVIAHSKGGLDIRYAISSLHMAEHVASLTTMSTPHNGSLTVDRLFHLPKCIIRFVAACSDLCLRICGDKNPNAYRVFESFTTEFCRRFNEENPNAEGVYYQSFAFIMKKNFSDILMVIPHFVVKFFEGDNDGLLAPRAVQWGNFRGVYMENSRRGISHCDEVDLRRKRFTKKSGDGISDIVEFYEQVVKELGDRGF